MVISYNELIAKVKKEGNFKEFYSHGYKCQIHRVAFDKRKPHIGHLCGYVGIPKNHSYSDHTGNRLSVHGGITYGGAKRFPKEDKDGDFIVFGFDCAHAGDLLLSTMELLADSYGGVNEFLKKHEHDQYRDMEYVTKECERLAKQLKDLE